MDALAVLAGGTTLRNPQRAPTHLPVPLHGRQAGRRGWHGFAAARGWHARG